MTATREPRDGSLKEIMMAETTPERSGASTLASLIQSWPLLARIPTEALERAAVEGPLTEAERRGDVEAELREAQRLNRWLAWVATVRDWPDDDFAEVDLRSLGREQQPVLLQRFLASQRQVAIISGPTGTGKTYAAFAAAASAAAEGHYVAAISHKRYLDSLEPDGGREPDWAVRNRARDAEVLVIDDFGAEMDPTQRASEFRARETTDLLSARMKPGKQTLVTTNLTPEELAFMFGDRIISRLNNGCVPIILQGQDRRRLGRAWG